VDHDLQYVLDLSFSPLERLDIVREDLAAIRSPSIVMPTIYI
jgi:hypothetical protein